MDIDAFILIGGRSSRLGTDKAFVEIDHEPLAVRVSRSVEEGIAPGCMTFVASNNDQFTPDQLNSLGSSVIFDPKPGFGAWSGLHTALSHTESEWIFLMACDYPFISPEFLKLLAGKISDEVDIVVPRQTDLRLQPLCAFYRVSSSLVSVETTLVSGGHLPPLTTLFDNLRTCVVEPDEYDDLPNAEKLFLNINTENDLAAALS